MSASFALPYEEPNITTILTVSSFTLLLNVTNKVLDNVLYCGLVGQVLIGTAWGTPGAKWLSTHFENAVTDLGYLGLILIVFEGGLATSFPSLKRNLLHSSCVAVTGIALPIAFSFCLLGLTQATPLQAFAAGAALCSTSLGTTFTILRTSGLVDTRLGTILTSAAMMDDVVGLVMVQVIGSLGNSAGPFKAVTVVRPIAVSIGLVVLLLLCCRFIVSPLTSWMLASRSAGICGVIEYLSDTKISWCLQTVVLVGLVAAASYAGTSNLFAAYLAGATISWWVTTFRVCQVPASTERGSRSSIRDVSDTARPEKTVDPAAIYTKYYNSVVEELLKPFFFASIGFSIPTAQLFSGAIVWRSCVYATLMLLAKLLTGLWLIRLPLGRKVPSSCKNRRPGYSNTSKHQADDQRLTVLPGVDSTAAVQELRPQIQEKDSKKPKPRVPLSNEGRPRVNPICQAETDQCRQQSVLKAVSLYPGFILGSAMVARGEIGFLIASTANSNGVFSGSSSQPSAFSETFLIVIWAILLCTIIGPVATGLMVERVKRLQKDERRVNEKPDPLGVWGVT